MEPQEAVECPAHPSPMAAGRGLCRALRPLARHGENPCKAWATRSPSRRPGEPPNSSPCPRPRLEDRARQLRQRFQLRRPDEAWLRVWRERQPQAGGAGRGRIGRASQSGSTRYLTKPPGASPSGVTFTPAGGAAPAAAGEVKNVATTLGAARAQSANCRRPSARHARSRRYSAPAPRDWRPALRARSSIRRSRENRRRRSRDNYW